MSHRSVDAISGRPTDRLPVRELFRLSLYWLGLSSIFAGVNTILAGRIEFDALVPPEAAGRTLFLLTIGGTIIAMVVQPTIGSISDYTISRWGRRKPYIFIGSILDVVFLVGIAFSQPLIAIAAFVRAPAVQLQLRAGPVPGLRSRSRPGTAGRDWRARSSGSCRSWETWRASSSPDSRSPAASSPWA